MPLVAEPPLAAIPALTRCVEMIDHELSALAALPRDMAGPLQDARVAAMGELVSRLYMLGAEWGLSEDETALWARGVSRYAR